MKTIKEIAASNSDEWTLADCADVLEAVQVELAKITERKVQYVTKPLRENGFALNEFYGLKGDLLDIEKAIPLASVATLRIETLFDQFREIAVEEARIRKNENAYG